MTRITATEFYVCALQNLGPDQVVYLISIDWTLKVNRVISVM